MKNPSIEDDYFYIAEILAEWGERSLLVRFFTAHRTMMKINRVFKKRLFALRGDK